MVTDKCKDLVGKLSGLPDQGDAKMQDLLSSVKDTVRSNIYNKDRMNIFDALGISYREIYICRFLGALLDGHHLSKDESKAMFSSFLEKVLGVPAEEPGVVVLEDVIDEKRRVDIVIYTASRIYPIEVKIGAIDQKNQIYDYWHHYHSHRSGAFPDDASIYYLTPNGRRPSEASRNGLDEKKIKPISFQYEIWIWIEFLLKRYEISIVTKNYLEQFMEVIASLKHLKLLHHLKKGARKQATSR